MPETWFGSNLNLCCPQEPTGALWDLSSSFPGDVAAQVKLLLIHSVLDCLSRYAEKDHQQVVEWCRQRDDLKQKLNKRKHSVVVP